MKTFVVNKKKYTSKPFDFNCVCDLEDMGITLEDMKRKSLSLIRGYLTICSGLDKEDAGAELQAHLISGEKLDSVTDAISHELEKSDFFRAIAKRAEAETAEMEDAEEKAAVVEIKKQKKENLEE